MEDDEVVLKGSELEKLLSSVRQDIETFSPNFENQLCTETREPLSSYQSTINSTSEKTVLAELICLKQLLLSCGLMLDEDIAFLVNEYPDHYDSKSFLRRHEEILLPGCCLMLIVSSYQLLKNAKWSIVLLLSSVGPTFFMAYKLFRVSRLRHGMEDLLADMNRLTRFIKNTTKTIKETIAVVNSRLILSSFRKMNPELIDRYYLQVKSDIDFNSHTFVKFLLEIICITREATRRILATGAFTNCSKSFFLASCSNEELGFPSFDDDSAKGISVTKLEELCIEYLVMQSEYLRALGMWLSSPVHTTPDAVSTNISFYRENISKKHRIAQQTFSGALFTRYLERKNLQIQGSTDIVLTKMNSALMALIIEAISLKHCLVEMELNALNDSTYFEFGLSNLESCYSNCAEIFKEARSNLRKQKYEENNQDSLKPHSKPENNLSAWKTGVEVGHSDFSVSGEDKVYLCITDMDESVENVNHEYSLISESPKYPNTLMNELRGVLEEKRIEFKQRESTAIKKSDLEEVENQFDLVLLNKPLEKFVEQSPAESAHITTECEMSRMPLFPVTHEQFDNSDQVTSLSDFSLSRSIAATAAKTSATWNCQTEEFFGDDDDDDDVDDESISGTAF